MKNRYLRPLCAILTLLMLLSALLACDRAETPTEGETTADITTEAATAPNDPAEEAITKTIYCKVQEDLDTPPVFGEFSKPYADYLANMTYRGEKLITVQLCHKTSGFPLALYEFTYENGKNPTALEVRGDESCRYTYEYDADGKLTKATRYSADGALEYLRAYEYNENDLLSKNTLQKKGEPNTVLAYEYDADGKVLITRQYLGDALCLTTEYKYEKGVLREKTAKDASGATILHHLFEVDEKGNLLETQYAGDVMREQWIYTSQGFLIGHTVWNAEGELQSGFSYAADQNGKVSLTVTEFRDAALPSQTPITLTTGYEFDENGETSRITLQSNGETVLYAIYEYAKDGNLSRTSIYGAGNKVFCKATSYVELCRAKEVLGDDDLFSCFAIVEYDTEQNLRVVDVYDPDTWKIVKYTEQGRNENYVMETYVTSDYDENGKLTQETRIAPDGTLTEFFGDTGWTNVTKWTEDQSQKEESFYAPDNQLFFTARKLYTNGALTGFEIYDSEGKQIVKCNKVILLGPDRQNGIHFERRYLIAESDGSYTLLTCLYEKGEMTFTQTSQN